MSMKCECSNGRKRFRPCMLPGTRDSAQEGMSGQDMDFLMCNELRLKSFLQLDCSEPPLLLGVLLLL